MFTRGDLSEPRQAWEEIVADVGSVFLLDDLGVCPGPMENQVSYIAHWLSKVGTDPSVVLVAAGLAEDAAAWLHQKAPGYRVGTGMVQLAAPALDYPDPAQKARDFVAAVEAWRQRTSGRDTVSLLETVRLLEAAGQIDFGHAGVQAAIKATVFLETADVADAVDYMETAESEIRRDLERTVADVRQRWQPRRTMGVRW